ERDRDQRARDDRQEPPEADQDRQRDQPDRQGPPVGLAEVPDQIPDLLEEVAATALDAEQLGQLARDDRERQADDEALEDGLRDEIGDEPQPQEARDHGDDAGSDRERRRQGDELAAP